MHLLLHLNKDFDDDLLLDAMKVLTHLDWIPLSIESSLNLLDSIRAWTKDHNWLLCFLSGKIVILESVFIAFNLIKWEGNGVDYWLLHVVELALVAAEAASICLCILLKYGMPGGSCWLRRMSLKWSMIFLVCSVLWKK